mgnify:CR=1
CIGSGGMLFSSFPIIMRQIYQQNYLIDVTIVNQFSTLKYFF